MHNNELYHHGILGMKWGVRRYQTKDGRLTEEGRRRLGRDIKSVRNISSTGVEGTRSLSNIVNRSSTSAKSKAKKSMDLSEMSNKELQDVITRLNLENNYRNLTTKDVSLGQERLNSILQTAGDILAVTASAASIAFIVNELLSKK